MFDQSVVLIKGAGDLATGAAARLWRAGFRLVLLELEQPLAIRRTVTLAEAVYAGQVTVEDLFARRVDGLAGVQAAWAEGIIPVVVDRDGCLVGELQPQVVVDGRLAKRNLGVRRGEAPFVIGMGPGFTAGDDVDAVIETQRGHYLGRVIWQGQAQPDSGAPGEIGGAGRERVIYSPAAGHLIPLCQIGDLVSKGQPVGLVEGASALAGVDGVLRGLIHSQVALSAGMKIGDVDPRAAPEHCRTISDKSLAVGGGVLEAVLMYMKQVERGEWNVSQVAGRRYTD